MKLRRKLEAAVVLLLMLMLATGAQAATVLDAFDFISGTDTRVYPFEIMNAGPYQVTLTDFEFLAPFEVLLLAITTGTTVVDTLVGPGVSTFQAAPGDFVANILGVAGEPFDLSSFRVQVAPVPIPATALLFSSGLIALIAVRRRRPRA
ncbi:MAG: hypothetical protein JSW39_02585 [Desulfobacterales bacterium]|nr:MAG: hypothetical protein JSW39_02585 [Desulfobacterales bacterium]